MVVAVLAPLSASAYELQEGDSIHAPIGSHWVTLARDMPAKPIGNHWKRGSHCAIQGGVVVVVAISRGIVLLRYAQGTGKSLPDECPNGALFTSSSTNIDHALDPENLRTK